MRPAGPRTGRAAAFALLAGLATAPVACGVRTEEGARFVDDEEVPFNLLDVTTTRPREAAAPTGTATASSVELCFVDDDQVVPTVRPAPAAIEPPEVVDLLVGGPSGPEEAAGLGSALPDRAVAGPVESAGGVAEVDLAGSFADTGGRQQLEAIAQIVCTLTARPGIGQVAFTLDGEPIAVPRGDASTTTDPVTRDDYRRLIANPDPVGL